MAADTVTAAPGAAPSTLTLETASQAGDLDAVARLAASIEGPAAAAPGGAATAPVADQVQRATNAQIIAEALKAGREGFCMFTGMVSPRATMSDAKCAEVAGLWGAWCDRRQIDLGTYMGSHADTLAAAMATFMLGVAVVQAARLELAQRRPVEVKTDTSTRAPAPPAEPAPAGSNVHVFPGTPPAGGES